MLIVPTALRSSSIHGVGLFILAPAKKGDLLWRFDSRIDKMYSRSEISTLPPLLQKLIIQYGAWHEASGLWALYNDNAKYINHSDNPVTNCAGPAIGDLTATQDLAADTELTVDYFKLCDMTRMTGKLAPENF